MGINRSIAQENEVSDYHMPDCIRHLGDIPLYRAVAWWGYIQGSEFTRNDVSRAFRIDPRRASGVLNYICNRHNPNDIEYRVRKLPPKHGNQLMSVQIIFIADSLTTKRDYSSTKSTKQDNASTNHDRLLAQWMLSRPVSKDITRFAEWRSKCPCETGFGRGKKKT